MKRVEGAMRRPSVVWLSVRQPALLRLPHSNGRLRDVQLNLLFRACFELFFFFFTTSNSWPGRTSGVIVTNAYINQRFYSIFTDNHLGFLYQSIHAPNEHRLQSL